MGCIFLSIEFVFIRARKHLTIIIIVGRIISSVSLHAIDVVGDTTALF